MKKKILCLVMTLVMTAGAATTAFARDYQGADGWQVTFDGSKMSSNFQDNDVTDEMANIQPGDSIELKVNVMNSDSGSTDWYMTNEVIQTLEDAQQSAAGGGCRLAEVYAEQQRMAFDLHMEISFVNDVQFAAKKMPAEGLRIQ